MAEAERTSNQVRERWLIAAWPGMGNVAVIAAGFLINKLAMRPAVELTARGMFDISHVEVEKGVIATPRTPRNLIFRSPEPIRGVELTVFVGEAQPTQGAYALAHEVIEQSLPLGIDRVATFASMASQLHPSQQPRVFGAVTEASLLGELTRAEVQVMPDGQIGGLNGVLLGAAAERGLPGLCLLGEIPFFAAGVPNPKAAKAVLDAFAVVTRIEIDLEELAQHAVDVERVLLEMMERMQRQGDDEEHEPEAGAEDEAEGESAEPPAPGAVEAAPPQPPASPISLDQPTLERIERLFEEAIKDRTKAVTLKRELDRLGVFRQYEDRFLDLFRRAE